MVHGQRLAAGRAISSPFTAAAPDRMAFAFIRLIMPFHTPGLQAKGLERGVYKNVRFNVDAGDELFKVPEELK